MEGERGRAAVGNPFSPLRHKSFLIYWIGMTVSTMGTWMQNVAQPWLALEITGSNLLFGIVSSLQFLPVLLFSMPAGVLIDRFPKKKLLMVTQAAMFFITLALAVLVMTGAVRYWHLLVSSTLMGVVSAFDTPARHSFVVELVGREDLTAGIALNSAQFNLSRMIAPAVAGLLMPRIGAAPIFLINALTYGVVVFSMLGIKAEGAPQRGAESGRILANIADGLRYIFSRPALYTPLAIMLVTAVFCNNQNVLVPMFSREILGQSEDGLGVMMSLVGVGSLAGALVVASLRRGAHNVRILYAFPVITGALVLLVGVQRSDVLTGALLVAIGFFFMVLTSICNSSMQLCSDDAHRGRVMSIYSLVFSGSGTLGSLYCGALAQRGNPGVAFIACGVAAICLMLPIYGLILYHRDKKIELGEAK